MAMSKDAQLEHLMLWTLGPASNLMPKIAYGCATICLLCALVFHPMFAFGTFFFLLFGFSSKELDENMKYAIEGLENNQTENILISVQIDKDSESNGHNLYTCGKDGKIWEMYFRPSAWKPKTGEYKAKVYYHPKLDWPVLIETEEGWIYPVSIPKQEKLYIN